MAGSTTRMESEVELWIALPDRAQGDGARGGHYCHDGDSAPFAGPRTGASADCRSRNCLKPGLKSEWSRGRVSWIDHRRSLAAKRGPPPSYGLESKRSVQEEERQEDSEGSSGVSSNDGGVVEAEFQAEAEAATEAAREENATSASVDDIGKAISELRKERLASGVQSPTSTTDFWQGVAEETTLIEWPALPKVLGTTGVVVGMILGSSVVLLTVNAILSEGSDLVFSNPAFKEFARGTFNLSW